MCINVIAHHGAKVIALYDFRGALIRLLITNRNLTKFFFLNRGWIWLKNDIFMVWRSKQQCKICLKVKLRGSLSLGIYFLGKIHTRMKKILYYK